MSPLRGSEQFKMTLLGLVANLGMGLLKMAGGSFLHSQALTADGFHSLADSITDLTAMATLHLDSSEITQRYMSSSMKTEDLGAILIASIVLAGGVALGKEAFSSGHGHSHLTSPHAVWFCLGSIVMKEILYAKSELPHCPNNPLARFSKLISKQLWRSQIGLNHLHSLQVQHTIA